MNPSRPHALQANARTDAAAANQRIYDRLPPGQLDYWKKMAAPRFRMDTILRELRTLAPQRVADLGCGTGLLLARTAEEMPAAARAGVDIAGRQLDLARQADRSADWYEVDLDAEAPVLPSALVGTCDAIVAAELVEHLDHPVRMLRTARRLASDGGTLILSTQSGPLRETERRVGHVRHFTVAGMESLLREAGWRPERVWNAGWPFHDLSKWWANRNPDGSMERFGEHAYGWRENLVCWGLRQLFRLNSDSRGAQLFAVARAD